MLIILPYCLRDEAQALKNAKWIASLKHNNPHQFLLVHDSRCDPTEIGKYLGNPLVAGLKVFDPYNRWPHSANTMFCQAARHIQTLPNKYFLWLEPDAVPLGDYAFDKIEQEYNRANARFMGHRTNSWQNCPAHLSGIAVYPSPLVQYAGAMLLSEGEATPFDVIDAERVITQSHFTDLIQNVARRAKRVGDTWIPVHEARSYKDKADFYSVATRECVLFHSDKFGTLIDIFGGAGVKQGADIERNTDKEETPPVPPPPPDILRQPKEGEKSNGMVYLNGGWQMDTGYRAEVESAKQPKTMQEHVDYLKRYAEDNGFSRMRVYKALKRAGLRGRAKKKTCQS
jgi:hypothetical protein